MLKGAPDEQPVHSVKCAERKSEATCSEGALINKGSGHDAYDHHRSGELNAALIELGGFARSVKSVVRQLAAV